MKKSIARRLVEWRDTASLSEHFSDILRDAEADVAAELTGDARDAMSLPPRDRGRRIGVQVGRWFVGFSR
jgi:hypothetical protein